MIYLLRVWSDNRCCFWLLDKPRWETLTHFFVPMVEVRVMILYPYRIVCIMLLWRSCCQLVRNQLLLRRSLSSLSLARDQLIHWTVLPHVWVQVWVLFIVLKRCGPLIETPLVGNLSFIEDAWGIIVSSFNCYPCCYLIIKWGILEFFLFIFYNFLCRCCFIAIIFYSRLNLSQGTASRVWLNMKLRWVQALRFWDTTLAVVWTIIV